jgi:hypothetical protein
LLGERYEAFVSSGSDLRKQALKSERRMGQYSSENKIHRALKEICDFEG